MLQYDFITWYCTMVLWYDIAICSGIVLQCVVTVIIWQYHVTVSCYAVDVIMQ